MAIPVKGSQLGGLWERFPELRTFSVPVFRLSCEVWPWEEIYEGTSLRININTLKVAEPRDGRNSVPRLVETDWTNQPWTCLISRFWVWDVRFSLFKPFELGLLLVEVKSVLNDTCYFSHLKITVFYLSADICVYISYIPWDRIMIFSYFFKQFQVHSKIKKVQRFPIHSCPDTCIVPTPLRPTSIKRSPIRVVHLLQVEQCTNCTTTNRESTWTHYHPSKTIVYIRVHSWCWTFYGCVCVIRSVISDSNPMDCGLPGSSVHGILQAKILNWIAFPFSVFPDGSEDKASSCHMGDLGSIPGLGRSPGEGNGNPLQYSCRENPMDGGAWRATVHGIAKSLTWLSEFTSLHFLSAGTFHGFRQM